MTELGLPALVQAARMRVRVVVDRRGGPVSRSAAAFQREFDPQFTFVLILLSHISATHPALPGKSYRLTRSDFPR